MNRKKIIDGIIAISFFIIIIVITIIHMIFMDPYVLTLAIIIAAAVLFAISLYIIF